MAEQNFDLDDTICVIFTDEKHFECSISGEIVDSNDDFLICEPKNHEKVLRFRIDTYNSTIELLVAKENNKEVFSYDYDEISKETNITEMIQDNTETNIIEPSQDYPNSNWSLDSSTTNNDGYRGIDEIGGDKVISEDEDRYEYVQAN